MATLPPQVRGTNQALECQVEGTITRTNVVRCHGNVDSSAQLEPPDYQMKRARCLRMREPFRGIRASASRCGGAESQRPITSYYTANPSVTPNIVRMNRSRLLSGVACDRLPPQTYIYICTRINHGICFVLFLYRLRSQAPLLGGLLAILNSISDLLYSSPTTRG